MSDNKRDMVALAGIEREWCQFSRLQVGLSLYKHVQSVLGDRAPGLHESRRWSPGGLPRRRCHAAPPCAAHKRPTPSTRGANPPHAGMFSLRFREFGGTNRPHGGGPTDHLDEIPLSAARPHDWVSQPHRRVLSPNHAMRRRDSRPMIGSKRRPSTEASAAPHRAAQE